jgi:hypothetical protein
MRVSEPHDATIGCKKQVAGQMIRETRPISLKYSSFGPLFKGRREFLALQRASLCGAAD